LEIIAHIVIGQLVILSAVKAAKKFFPLKETLIEVFHVEKGPSLRSG
jgi:hypothetical protein